LIEESYLRIGVDGVEKQDVRNKMSPNKYANDYVESGFEKGNMGKERQKCLTSLKQRKFVLLFEAHRNAKRRLQRMVDVERRSCTSASHLSGSDINQHIFKLLPVSKRIGVKDEIVRPQNSKMLNSKLILKIIGNDSALLV
jgi:hypothetical protein